MNLEVSTINVLLGLTAALQAWIIKELVSIKIKLAVIAKNCPNCPNEKSE